jgi:hypothetical protein
LCSGAGRAEVDLLPGLSGIRSGEIWHCEGERYLTVVVGHYTGRWATPGADRAAVLAFFDALGEKR